MPGALQWLRLPWIQTTSPSSRTARSLGRDGSAFEMHFTFESLLLVIVFWVSLQVRAMANELERWFKGMRNTLPLLNESEIGCRRGVLVDDGTQNWSEKEIDRHEKEFVIFPSS